MFSYTGEAEMVELGGRKPGDPISGPVVREFRERGGLTQDELAQRLGVRGGKAVISGWETGRTACEGPAAEFLLHLLGGGDASLAMATLNADLEAVWNRASDRITSWRQVLVVPRAPVTVAPTTFVKLFPGAALPERRHGFPFTGVDLHGNVVGLTQSGWLGSIPADGQPSYVWMLKRDGRFGYREFLSEDSRRSSMGSGEIDVGTQLRLALETTHFLRRLAPMIGLGADLRINLQLDLEGVRGRALIDAHDDPGQWRFFNRWSEDHANAKIETSVGEIDSSPVDVGLRLVSEMAAQIGSNFTDHESLKRVLVNGKLAGSLLSFIDYAKL